MNESEKKKFIKSFENKLKNELSDETFENLKNDAFSKKINSNDYQTFREEKISKSQNLYEKYCNFFEKILKIKPDKKTKKILEEKIYLAHLNITPTGATSFSIGISLIILILGMMLFLMSSALGGGLIIIGLISYFVSSNIVDLFIMKRKTKLSDQVIVAIFYIVSYIRFSSNFERAIQFAATYLEPPMALDFKRLLWEINNAKYNGIKEAMDKYLEQFREDNLEFLESIYLIQSSLFEAEDFRKLTLLDKSLDVILQGNYEKILSFAGELKSKVSMLNMLGVILPILGLIILPLAASTGNPKSVFEFIVLIYNVVFPLGLLFFSFKLIFSFPTGVNVIKLPEMTKEIKEKMKYKINIFKKDMYINPKIPAFFIFIILFSIGIIPLLVANFNITGDELDQKVLDFKGFGIEEASPFSYFLRYKAVDDGEGNLYSYGPYGVFPGIFSLLIPLSFAFSIGFYLKNRYKNLLYFTRKTKNLERQFSSAMFQLGNRLNEGLSTELAFGYVANSMKGTEASEFFYKIDKNIKFNGYSVEKAIFDKEFGAILEYPSQLIISSMKIFLTAQKRGPQIASKTLIDLSRYLNELHLGNQRMKDLLADSMSSLKSQVSFLIPIISSVVISIVSLLSLILGNLSDVTKNLKVEGEVAQSTQISSIISDAIPTFWLQSSVGIYITMLLLILVYTISNLENGKDIILIRYEMGTKLISGMIKYSIVVFLGISVFGYISFQIMKGIL